MTDAVPATPNATTISRRRHILTVVLEDYCHVGPVSRLVPSDYWHRFESRVERNTRLTLDLLDGVDARATFFVLGWIAEHQPAVVAEIARRGHEVASKGFFHRSLRQMTPAQFREDVRRSRDVLEDACGRAVRGYRVPRGGIGRRDLWALDILAEEGFAYDSSMRPMGVELVHHPERRFVHRRRHGSGELWEVPLSSIRLGPLCMPVSGGNFVRQLPESFVRRAIRLWDETVDAPLVFYFHVWELDPEMPRISGVSALQRIRQYRNLDAMTARIRHYLDQYPFGTVAGYLGLADTAPPPRTRAAAAPAARIAATVPPPPRTAVTVVVPCFNEEAALGYTANMLRSFGEGVADVLDVRYLFVDDGSSDGTWRRLTELFGDRPDCRLVRHETNRGIAAATMTGIRASGTEIVCAIDCDGTYDPRQLRQMVPMLTPGVDLVTASPYHPSGAVINLPAWRLVLSKGLSTLYRSFHRHHLYTYTSCFRVYRRSAVADMAIDNERYVGITEILSRLDMRGGRIVECPAVMEVRLLGVSKMKVIRTIRGHLGLMAELLRERLRRTASQKQPC